jgi:hypothetical protein
MRWPWLSRRFTKTSIAIAAGVGLNSGRGYIHVWFGGLHYPLLSDIPHFFSVLGFFTILIIFAQWLPYRLGKIKRFGWARSTSIADWWARRRSREPKYHNDSHDS